MKELCEDWCKYVKRGYESDSLSVTYLKRLKDYEREGVCSIASGERIVYDYVNNVLMVGDWMRKMRDVINAEIMDKKMDIFLEGVVAEYQDNEYRKTLLDL